MARPGGALAKGLELRAYPVGQAYAIPWNIRKLEGSHNLAENSMRPVALGRRNWIHIGSSPAGPKIAAILSVVESCRRLRLPVRDWPQFFPGARISRSSAY